MVKQAVGAGLVGLGLIGGAGSVVYKDDGSASVTIKDTSGATHTVRLEGSGRSYSCPPETDDRLSPYDIRLGRIDLTIRQVHREAKGIEVRYPGRNAPARVIARYRALERRDKRLISEYNRTVDERNGIISADCE